MKKIQILRILNNIILFLSTIGYFIIWKDTIKANEAIDLLGMMNVVTYVKAYLIQSVIISFLIWLFISTFCEKAEDTKQILSLLRLKNIHKEDRQKQIKNKKPDDKFNYPDEHPLNNQVEKMKKKVSANELIVKVKGSGKIEKIKKDDWEEIISLGNEDKFEIQYKNF
mgnify:CR=1 FL=1